MMKATASKAPTRKQMAVFIHVTAPETVLKSGIVQALESRAPIPKTVKAKALKELNQVLRGLKLRARSELARLKREMAKRPPKERTKVESSIWVQQVRPLLIIQRYLESLL